MRSIRDTDQKPRPVARGAGTAPEAIPRPVAPAPAAPTPGEADLRGPAPKTNSIPVAGGPTTTARTGRRSVSDFREAAAPVAALRGERAIAPAPPPPDLPPLSAADQAVLDALDD